MLANGATDAGPPDISTADMALDTITGDDHVPSCAIDPTGMFTFHVHNAGAQTLHWDLGCKRSVPIVLHLPAGDMPTGPGAVDTCEYTCEQVYAATAAPGLCTDCGAGYVGTVAPGASGDIVWDRRVYTAYAFDPACRTPSGITPGPGATCALGHTVAPSATQSGTLAVCPGTVYPRFCSVNNKQVAFSTVEFTVDTTGAEATIEVQ